MFVNGEKHIRRILCDFLISSGFFLLITVSTNHLAPSGVGAKKSRRLSVCVYLVFGQVHYHWARIAVSIALVMPFEAYVLFLAYLLTKKLRDLRKVRIYSLPRHPAFPLRCVRPPPTKPTCVRQRARPARVRSRRRLTQVWRNFCRRHLPAVEKTGFLNSKLKEFRLKEKRFR